MQRAIAVFDIDGVVRDVAGSYLRALADTVEHFTDGAFRPSLEQVDDLKAEGQWNNDWEASQELVYRFFEQQGQERAGLNLDYQALVDFFQHRYRGTDWTGYIRDEPLLLSADYLESLTAAGVGWGFFSGATRASATYVLEGRLGLRAPLLVAMEDAPGKPDPTGLLMAVSKLAPEPPVTVFYVGDTVADMQTVERARTIGPEFTWRGVGIIPPHVKTRSDYARKLSDAGAAIVLEAVDQLNASLMLDLS
ncbi:MAG: TIGR01548 family HAD-type hydrolase [Aphanocapsa sp. GSE-SYN-MK-11-07L]|nr:TIGR01548 family HAD-type hydrolase [Aphanocapsa sp. GSE-SYN-MK-11-07L]